jgi:hypothetical protein
LICSFLTIEDAAIRVRRVPRRLSNPDKERRERSELNLKAGNIMLLF